MIRRILGRSGFERYGRLALFAAAALLLGAACGPGKTPSARTSVRTGGANESARAIILVATERFDRGGRLVGVTADGSRHRELTDLAGEVILDRSPFVTPDARWVVFASNRNRSDLRGSNLWRVPFAGGAPVPLTSGPQVDRDPRVSPDGRWLYFCSNREGSFDLYRGELSIDGELGDVERVIASPGQILSPGISPDGKDVAYMEVDTEGASRLWRAHTFGDPKPVALTEGPNDMTPDWSPDGSKIAFAARVPGRADADVYIMPAAGGDRIAVSDAPLTDETGPRWADGGRALFAIGMYRSARTDAPLLGSVIGIVLGDAEPVWRALHDPSTVETRIGLGLMPDAVSAPELRVNAPYTTALREVLIRAVRSNESRQSREPQQ